MKSPGPHRCGRGFLLRKTDYFFAAAFMAGGE
jgi:hypothetical protein